MHANLFNINDPFGLRKKVIPLLNYNHEENTVTAWGTSFRIDPFGTLVTAYHVIEDFIEMGNSPQIHSLQFRSDKGLFGLESPGLIYGKVRVRNKLWSLIEDAFTHVRLPNDAFVEPPIRNVCETALLKMSNRDKADYKFLPVDLSYRPTVSERLLAVGFPYLNVKGVMMPDRLVEIEDQFHGSYGSLVEIRDADPPSGRPWPTLIIEGSWPLGMSGGPVLNSNGHVIGLVSTGIGDSLSTAVWFGGWGLHAQLMGQLDPHNPGWLRGWGIFDSNNKLKIFHTGSPDKIIGIARSLGMTEIDEMSWEYGTENMIRSRARI